MWWIVGAFVVGVLVGVMLGADEEVEEYSDRIEPSAIRKAMERDR